MSERTVTVEVNGVRYTRAIEPRMLLSDFLRHELGLTGTHVGCEHGVCGACTVQVDGAPVRSCLMLAVQCDGCRLRTVEGMTEELGGRMHVLQEAFHDAHGLQCGFCTPGILMSIEPLLHELDGADEAAIREALGGNVCRCTGYQGIVDAVRLAVERLHAAPAAAEAPR
jgi:aerobic-type carbon monoxide dehydrogenase small subunit (CoxS/CutS family)